MFRKERDSRHRVEETSGVTRDRQPDFEQERKPASNKRDGQASSVRDRQASKAERKIRAHVRRRERSALFDTPTHKEMMDVRMPRSRAQSTEARPEYKGNGYLKLKVNLEFGNSNLISSTNFQQLSLVYSNSLSTLKYYMYHLVTQKVTASAFYP